HAEDEEEEGEAGFEVERERRGRVGEDAPGGEAVEERRRADEEDARRQPEAAGPDTELDDLPGADEEGEGGGEVEDEEPDDVEVAVPGRDGAPRRPEDGHGEAVQGQLERGHHEEDEHEVEVGDLAAEGHGVRGGKGIK